MTLLFIFFSVVFFSGLFLLITLGSDDSYEREPEDDTYDHFFT